MKRRVEQQETQRACPLVRPYSMLVGCAVVRVALTVLTAQLLTASTSGNTNMGSWIEESREKS